MVLLIHLLCVAADVSATASPPPPLAPSLPALDRLVAEPMPTLDLYPEAAQLSHGAKDARNQVEPRNALIQVSESELADILAKVKSLESQVAALLPSSAAAKGQKGDLAYSNDNQAQASTSSLLRNANQALTEAATMAPRPHEKENAGESLETLPASTDNAMAARPSDFAVADALGSSSVPTRRPNEASDGDSTKAEMSALLSVAGPPTETTTLTQTTRRTSAIMAYRHSTTVVTLPPPTSALDLDSPISRTKQLTRAGKEAMFFNSTMKLLGHVQGESSSSSSQSKPRTQLQQLSAADGAKALSEGFRTVTRSALDRDAARRR